MYLRFDPRNRFNPYSVHENILEPFERLRFKLDPRKDSTWRERGFAKRIAQHQVSKSASKILGCGVHNHWFIP
jgi:hypothetical protein